MAENLLWPTKLKQPPKLLIDPAALFGDSPTPPGTEGKTPLHLLNQHNYGESGVHLESLRFINAESNYFRVGLPFYMRSTPDTDPFKMTCTLPIQNASAQFDGCICSGWHNESFNGEPDKVISKTTLSDPPIVSINPIIDSYNRGSLFKMQGDNLEDNGSGKQFSSNGTYSYLHVDCNVGSIIINDFIDIVTEFFPDVPASASMTLEFIIKITASPAVTPNGFEIGFVSS